MKPFNLTKFKPDNKFLVSKQKKAGRSNHGRITVRHQGGGHKQYYRIINWARPERTGIIANFEYDPNRTALLAKLYHPTEDIGTKVSYILAPKGIKIFDKLRSFSSEEKNVFLRQGDRTSLSNFEAGDLVHAVENIPGKGALFARAAGTFCQVLQHDSKEYAKIRLPSGSQRLIPNESKATYGILANEKHNQRIIGKAGRSRWLNKRPSVRGVAMNPVDHPHGGGQGKTKGGRPSVTPYSWPTKGQPTRNPRKRNPMILTPRKTKKRK